MNKNHATNEEYTSKQNEYYISIYLLVVKGYVEELVKKEEEKCPALALRCHNGCTGKYNGSYLGIMDANTQRSCFVFSSCSFT